MSRISFGTDGWRAVIAAEFTFANVKKVAQGIANYFKNHSLLKKGIAVGYDNRFLSEKFAAECARVLLGNGIKTYLFKRAVPTPLTAFAIHKLNLGGGVMITASHNPPQYNGIKFIPEYAGPALPAVTQEIEEEIQKVIEGSKLYELDIKEAEALDLISEIDLEKDYLAHLRRLLSADVFKEASVPLKVVVDPMYGSGVGYLDKILTELGCEVRTINNYRDPLFGGSMPEPTDAVLTDLKRAVISYKADLGLALDGDADRFGIIDASGEFVSPNHFAFILFHHLLKTRSARGPVSRTVATTHMLDHIARENGLNVIETPVGFKYISEALREKACILGVEESGGLSILGHVPEKDGILACLLAVEIMYYNAGKKFRQIGAELGQQYGWLESTRLDIKTTEGKKKTILEEIEKWNPRSLAGKKVETMQMGSAAEGKKVILEGGSWVLIRPSGTEPLFRVYIEAENSELLKALQQEVLEKIKF